MPFAALLRGIPKKSSGRLLGLVEKLLTKERDLNQVAINVLKGEMRLLDIRCNFGRDDHVVVA
jgi:hypothetical protein